MLIMVFIMLSPFIDLYHTEHNKLDKKLKRYGVPERRNMFICDLRLQWPVLWDVRWTAGTS